MLCLSSVAAAIGGSCLRGLQMLCPSWTRKADTVVLNEVVQPMEASTYVSMAGGGSLSCPVAAKDPPGAGLKLGNGCICQGLFKSGRPCHAECDVISSIRQPRKDVAAELRHLNSALRGSDGL